MGELEEEQHAELFQVVAVGEAVVAEDCAVAPELLDDAVGFGAHGVVFSRDSGPGQSAGSRHQPCTPCGIRH